jgi:hypothetical protein
MSYLPSRPRPFMVGAALAALVAGAWAIGSRAVATGSAPAPASASAQGKSSRRPPARRNLSMQPEAVRAARRLGGRFAPDSRERSVLVGAVTLGAERRNVRVERSQTDDGEGVSIDVEGSQRRLTWDAGQGARASGEPAADDRDLIERLALDSPDQFVLAQLRGASYYTVARAVRPEGAGDDYAGPLWDIVRVDEANRDADRLSRSPWRLYYVNTRTGLIDKVVSEVAGERVEAALGGWTNAAGEQFPEEISWTRKGQVIMRFNLTNFSHARQ